MSLNTFCIGLSGGEGTSTVLSSVTTVAEEGAHPQGKYGCSIRTYPKRNCHVV
ncbi:hypothetical protein [Photorhabdus temperata]|uniref:hypothetical protein n=1 Tax=Photorhabdus temperata TaxID=574560 RepID=UPI0013E2DF75|nr:hypothetical protein [Photorhabdus temperata]